MWYVVSVQRGLSLGIMPTSPPRADGGVANKEAGSAKVHVGRTQSAQPTIVPVPAADPPLSHSFNDKGAMGLESNGAEIGQPRHGMNSTNASAFSPATNTVTSSPSRESRERAEEVARKVVSAAANVHELTNLRNTKGQLAFTCLYS